MARTKNPFLAAFLLPANLVGLATAAASSAMTGDTLPAMVALGLEGLYLGVMSANPRFRRSVAAGAGAEEAGAQVAALLAELSPSQRQQYEALRELRNRILANYRKLPGGRVLAASSEARLDSLLTSFVRLLGSLNSYRAHLSPSARRAVEAELRDLQREVAEEDNPRIRDVKQRRVDILGRRVARFHQAEESREVVAHQLAAIEDLLRLTHDQSITLRDAESATRQLDALSVGVEASEETVREMERMMDFTEETGPGLSHGERVRT